MNRGIWIIHVVVPHFRREFANRRARAKETANVRPIRIRQTDGSRWSNAETSCYF